MTDNYEAAVGMARATGSVAVTYNGVRVEQQPDGTFAQVADASTPKNERSQWDQVFDLVWGGRHGVGDAAGATDAILTLLVPGAPTRDDV